MKMDEIYSLMTRNENPPPHDTHTVTLTYMTSRITVPLETKNNVVLL